MNLFRKIALGISGALFVSVIPTALADHTWGTYHWARTSSPFTLQVIDSVTNFWWADLDFALSNWAEAQSLELQVTQTENDETTRSNCPMVTGKIRICNWTYGQTGWLGLATVGVDSSGHVDRGVTRINDSYSAYWGNQTYKNKVVCHEVGHLFGLGHTSEDGSSQKTCMDYAFGTDSQFPNAHDYDLLDNTIYAHLDNHNSYDASLDTGSSTGGTTTGGDTGGTTTGGCSGKGNDKNCNGIPDNRESGSTTDGSTGGSTCRGNSKNCNKLEQGNWVSHLPPLGTRVAQSRRGEVWVSSRKDGGLWIHHVLLAEENEQIDRGAGNDGHNHGAHHH
ncbi:MAG: hypothetical protein KDI29_14575 [Pseudomonadales bacterium]|nr:hypothetical protein [Pseudomonadales bacterium]